MEHGVFIVKSQLSSFMNESILIRNVVAVNPDENSRRLLVLASHERKVMD